MTSDPFPDPPAPADAEGDRSRPSAVLRAGDADLLYRAFVDELSDMVSLSEADGTLVYVNTSYARYFGKLPSDLIGSSLYAWIDPGDRAAVAALLAQVLDSGTARHGENRMVGADGAERWVAWTNDLQTDSRGHRLLRSVGRDVTQRIHTDLALRASQAFLQRTGRVAGIGGWELDLVTGTLTWSDEVRRIHEVDAGFQPTLDQAIAFYSAEARPLIEVAVQRAIATGEAWDLELRFITAKGRPIWVRAVGEAEFEQGRAVRLLGAFQDISERRRLEQQVADSEGFLRRLTDSVPVRIAYLDRERRYGFVNDELLRHLGRERDEVLGRTRAELLPGAAEATLALRAAAALAGQTQQFEFEESIDGRMRRIENRLVPDRDASGAVRGFFVTGVDITERHAAEQAVARQTATLRSVTEAIAATVAVVDPEGRYRFVNGAFERWCGLPSEQILGRHARDVLGAPEYERRRDWVDRSLAGGAVDYTLTYPSDGTELHLAVSHVPLRLATGESDGFVVVSQDISMQKREEGRLLQLAQRDPLTGLLNRAGFEQGLDALAAAGQAASGGAGGLAVLYLDLDNFKPINDRYGHPVGDQVLEQFAQRLLALVRASDLVARLGGDEFAVAVAGLRDVTPAQQIADKVLVAAATPFQVGSITVTMGASVGVAHSADSGAAWRELLAQADTRLLAAKADGKGRQFGA